MSKLTDEDVMPFGKYSKSRTKMKDVPAKYLLWLGKELEPYVLSKMTLGQQHVREYIRENKEVLEKELKENK